jgi:hypothetical protein
MKLNTACFVPHYFLFDSGACEGTRKNKFMRRIFSEMIGIKCVIRLVALLIIGSTIAAAHAAAANGCQDFPRNVGLFGAMDRQKESIEISRELQAQLPKARAIREAKQTDLTAMGEQVIMYDTDESPHIAIVVQGVLSQTYDLSKIVEKGLGGIYATSCEFQLSPTQKALAIAYTLSGDGTGSVFLILTWAPETKYEVVFHETVGQGRIMIGSGKLDLWESTRGKYASRPESPEFECEWCKHKYLISEFRWRDGKYNKTRSRLTSKSYDPAEISGKPIQIE